MHSVLQKTVVVTLLSPAAQELLLVAYDHALLADDSRPLSRDEFLAACEKALTLAAQSEQALMGLMIPFTCDYCSEIHFDLLHILSATERSTLITELAWISDSFDEQPLGTTMIDGESEPMIDMLSAAEFARLKLVCSFGFCNVDEPAYEAVMKAISDNRDKADMINDILAGAALPVLSSSGFTSKLVDSLSRRQREAFARQRAITAARFANDAA